MCRCIIGWSRDESVEGPHNAEPHTCAEYIAALEELVESGCADSLDLEIAQRSYGVLKDRETTFKTYLASLDKEMLKGPLAHFQVVDGEIKPLEELQRTANNQLTYYGVELRSEEGFKAWDEPVSSLTDRSQDPGANPTFTWDYHDPDKLVEVDGSSCPVIDCSNKETHYHLHGDFPCCKDRQREDENMLQVMQRNLIYTTMQVWLASGQKPEGVRIEAEEGNWKLSTPQFTCITNPNGRFLRYV